MRIGHDVEVLLQDKNGKHISVIGFIGANKWNPMQVPDMPKGFTLQEDNVALEYGIPPASSAEELWNFSDALMKKSLEYVKGLSFSKLSCTVFDADQMQAPEAHVFGCEPDMNAWTGDFNPSPEPPHPFMRSAGGHIHVETKLDPFMVVRAMDLFLGVPAVLMDKGSERKKFYGKAGAMRIKPYGVEARSLSNFWIFEKRLCAWVWDNTKRALEHVEQGLDIPDVQGVINSNDVAGAQRLIAQYGLEVVQ